MTIEEILKKGKSGNLTDEELFDFFNNPSEDLLNWLNLEKKNGEYVEKKSKFLSFGENDNFWGGFKNSSDPFYHTRVFVEDSNYGNRVEFVDDLYPQEYGTLLTLQETILRNIPVTVYPTTDPNLIFYFTIHGGKVI